MSDKMKSAYFALRMKDRIDACEEKLSPVRKIAALVAIMFYYFVGLTDAAIAIGIAVILSRVVVDLAIVLTKRCIRKNGFDEIQLERMALA